MNLKALLFTCLLSNALFLQAQLVCVPIMNDPSLECDTIMPWTTNSTTWVYSSDAQDGDQSFEIEGNFNLQYDFPADGFPVAQLGNASFWTWHDVGAGGIMSTEWGYSDGSSGGECCFSGGLDGWVEIDLLPLLDITKNLQWVRVWGYSGGSQDFDDITRFDAFNFCTNVCDTVDSCGVCEGLDLCCEIPAGIEPIEKWESEFLIYPNPANSQLNLRTNYEGNGILNIEFIDASGRLVQADQIQNGQSIDIQKLNPGFYNVILTVNGDRHSSPLIIQR